MAQFMYDSTEQQGDEEVGQLTGGYVDTGNLKDDTQAVAERKRATGCLGVIKQPR